MRDLWLEIIADMEARRQKGLATYGKPVSGDACEEWLQHASEEFLDGLVYAKAAKVYVEGLKQQIIEQAQLICNLKDILKAHGVRHTYED